MNSDKPKNTYYYKLFRVKRNDGKATTVSVDPLLVTKALQLMGGMRPVGKIVREAALDFDGKEQSNRSGYVTNALREAVSAAARERRAQQALRATQAAYPA